MSLITSLPAIDKLPECVVVMHEKSEKYIPTHQHTKGQLSYVEGGIAYVQLGNKTFLVPARHYFWIPQGVEHQLKVSHSATVLRSLFFYADDDDQDPFYTQVGIYPIHDLLLQMIKYSEKWEGPVSPQHKGYRFLSTIKSILPDISIKALSIALPSTNNAQMQEITHYLQTNIAANHSLESISNRFNLSDRSLSRLFQLRLGTSFLQYLKLLRMVKAFEMILQTNKPMTEIAYAIGYQSLSSFSHTFHQFTNFRPTDFDRPK